MGFLSEDRMDLRPADLLLFYGSKEFDTHALDTHSHIKSIFVSRSNNAKSGAFIFHRTNFYIHKEMRAQLGSRLSSNFMPAFNDALCAFNTKMETDILSNANEIAAPKLMKKLADIYFTRVTQTTESTFSLSSRQIALWKSQMEDHTSDWLRAVLISGLGQTMNGDIYGDHAVSCASIIGIKHRHNVVRDTMVDICFRSGISARKEVDIGLGEGCDKPLRLADMLLYSWDEGLDVCVDLTGSSPLTQTGMVDFVPSHAVIDAAHRKRVKYEAKCANIEYGFLPFSFSSLGELEKDGEVLELIADDGPRCGLHLNVTKTEIFRPKEDPRSRVEGAVSVDSRFSSDLVLKRVTKTIALMDSVAKINDPQCELLLLRACTGISKLYFAMRKCPPCVFESAQRSFDIALRSALEHIVTAFGPGFGDWQWRIATLPFAFGGFVVYSAAPGSIFDDALCMFNDSMEIDFLCNPKSTFSLSPRQMALWKSQREDHTSDWLRAVPISGLVQLAQGFLLGKFKGITLFHVLGLLGLSTVTMLCVTPLSTSVFDRGFQRDGGLDVCVDLTRSSPLTQTGMTDFAPGHMVTDTAHHKRKTDVVTLLKRIQKFSMVQDIGARAAIHIFNRISFAIAKGCAVIGVAQRKRGKYMAKCAAIGYGFLLFCFSSLGELEADVVTLLKRIRKFSMAQDIGARAAVHIFNRISFAIAKRVGAQIVSRLPSNLL
ncbi:hypothetical protein Tco_1136027 [Tanacetum coccineum]